ncbi:Sterile alpha motif domain-containing protein [Quillaja saponaria]|uniref:Sterile alpha motif domain-containing protein n=1 Tax=Quillaja saponaria TaxID=32244 RepID=A0AAD7PY72_QUISA|nr:Sterile alpha motif domain-containing protein [Quillaja saponaria]
MVKTKQRRTGTVPGKKNGTRRGKIYSSDSNTHLDQHDPGDWVIVKKQRVTILVPPLAIVEKSITANSGPCHLQPMSLTTAGNSLQLPMVTCTAIPIVVEQEKSISFTSAKDIQVPSKTPPLQSISAEKEIQVPGKAPPLKSVSKLSTLNKPPRLDQRMESENPHRAAILESRDLLGVSNTPKAMKWPGVSHGASRPPGLTMFLSKGLRASNLERKLRRAGGLSRWLTSLGLGQFVRIFQGKSLNKYQLVNLTMNKLKDMGANAVGPRRKLMHAIECVCQPYCFETL